MGKTGVANLPLHGGKAPKWLFKRMVLLSKAIVEVLLYEYGNNELVRRLSDPFWFQALSCVLGFDWHSSGCTTVTCGALKEAINSEDYGFTLAGGKGKASRKTLEEIVTIGDSYNFSSATIKELQYASRMAAKVDTSAIQDGHQLYHHVFVCSKDKLWAVIQQGLNNETNYARRYHWCSDAVEMFVCEPHKSILGNASEEPILDMTSTQSASAQTLSVDLVNDHPRHLQRDWAMLTKHHHQQTLDRWVPTECVDLSLPCLTMPRSINWITMKELYDFQPKNYEELLSLQGVGPNTIRALALISDLIYDETPSWKDPVKYSFAVGGKDGVPFPVDRKAMDQSTEIIRLGIQQAKLGDKEKMHAIQRLQEFVSVSS